MKRDTRNLRKYSGFKQGGTEVSLPQMYKCTHMGARLSLAPYLRLIQALQIKNPHVSQSDKQDIKQYLGQMIQKPAIKKSSRY